MQAWGGIASACLSALAALAAIGLLWHEIRVRREEKADSEAAQARLIFGGVTFLRQGEVTEWGSMTGPATSLDWEIHNYSALPILDVVIAVSGGGLAARHFAQIDSVIVQHAEGVMNLERPLPLGNDSGHEDLGRFTVEIWFLDASGLLWHRIDRNAPERLLRSAAYPALSIDPDVQATLADHEPPSGNSRPTK